MLYNQLVIIFHPYKFVNEEEIVEHFVCEKKGLLKGGQNSLCSIFRIIRTKATVNNSAVQLILRCRLGLTVLLSPSILTCFPIFIYYVFNFMRKVGFDTLKDLMKSGRGVRL